VQPKAAESTRWCALKRLDPGYRIHSPRTDGVEANARLTGATAAVLLVLLAAEGATIPLIGPLLTPHIVIGIILIPPILLKMATTGYRFARYYTGDPRYRKKGPPLAMLRLLGPFVVVLTIAVVASGVALLFVSRSASWHSRLMLAHKASFVLWFGAMTIHVVAHLLDTAKLAPRDWYGRTRREVSGAGARQWAIVASLVAGLLLGLLFVPRASSYHRDRHQSGSGVVATTQLPPRQPSRLR
jgi:hypothetical protein